MRGGAGAGVDAGEAGRSFDAGGGLAAGCLAAGAGVDGEVAGGPAAGDGGGLAADGFGADLRAYLMQKTGNLAAPYAFSTYYPVVQEGPDANSVIQIAPLCNLGAFISAHGDHSDAIDFDGDGASRHQRRT